jgi:hypothetical protein
MKVSGFTFVRNAVRLGYPVVAAIRSILPIVDEMVVNVGVGDDGTLELIRGIGDPRLVIFETAWDDTLVRNGKVLAQQTDIALARCTGDVAVYVQADEAIHEDDHPALRASLARLHADPRAEGLLFEYVHFYGSFHTVGISRRWYSHEIRAVKLGIAVRSWRDAQGFRIGDGDRARKLAVLPSGARVFHYGWVRKPEDMHRKSIAFTRLYAGDEGARREAARKFAYDTTEKLRRFEGTHPAVMREWIARADWSYEPRPRWLRLAHLREDLLDLFELATGVRIGEYRNYRRLSP